MRGRFDEANSMFGPILFKWMPKATANDMEVDVGDCSTKLSIILDLPKEIVDGPHRVGAS